MNVIKDLGNGLSIAEVNISELREQDLNARIMGNDAFKQLVKNIKKRGGLESLPFCALRDGRIEIISGHHRIRACKVAKIMDIPVLLDKSGLTRSQIVAKQLAHNSLVGKDDEKILAQLYGMMDNVDDKLESFVDIDELKGNSDDVVKAVNLDDKLDFKTVQFLFTEREIADIDRLFARLESGDIVYVCRKEDFEPFVRKLENAKKAFNVRNASLAMSLLVKEGLEEGEDKDGSR